MSYRATNFSASNCHPNDADVAVALISLCSPFKERSEEDVIRWYKPVWAVGGELVAVASSSAIKVSLTNRTHLFKTCVTGRITKDWRANAAAGSMPRSNNYMHLMPDGSMSKGLFLIFLFFCVQCHKLVQLQEQKRCCVHG